MTKRIDEWKIGDTFWVIYSQCESLDHIEIEKVTVDLKSNSYIFGSVDDLTFSAHIWQMDRPFSLDVYPSNAYTSPEQVNNGLESIKVQVDSEYRSAAMKRGQRLSKIDALRLPQEEQDEEES